ncbi:hypothetical protein ACWC2M_12580, partial [Streptomyces sp. NPDC001761]
MLPRGPPALGATPGAGDGDWVLVAEELLKDAVDLGHAGFRAYRDERRRAYAEQPPLPELTEVLWREWAVRLPEHDITGLLREPVVTVHADAGGPFRWDRAVRGALAGLLRRDIETSDRRPWPVYVDLDEVRVLDATVFLGPALDMGPLPARAVLDLAAADTAAGLPLADRLRAWQRIAAADAGVPDRVLAAHLAAHPPPQRRERRGTAVVGPGGRGHRPAAGGPPDAGRRPAGRSGAGHLPARPGCRTAQRARAALGPAPAVEEIDRVLPGAGLGPTGHGASPVAGTAETVLAVWRTV